MKILRNLGLSYLLAIAAIAVLMTKTLYPLHRVVAFSLFGLSWIPFMLSFRYRSARLRLYKREVRKRWRNYAPYAGVALLLAIFAYAAWVLVPVDDSPLVHMSEADLERNMKQDLVGARILHERTDALLDWIEKERFLEKQVSDLDSGDRQEIAGIWNQFLTASLELEILKQTYKGFHHIDYVARPEQHAEAFLVAFSAFVTQYHATLRLVNMVGDNDFMATFLNESNDDLRTPSGSFAATARQLTRPDILLRLNAGSVYLRLVRKDLERDTELLSMLEGAIKNVFIGLGTHPEIFIEKPLELFERKAFSVWLPFQREVALRMSHIRGTRRPYFITEEIIGPFRGRLQPGDIMLERRSWHMTNAGIPGFWPHAALYVGTPGEMDAFFGALPELNGTSPSETIAARYPQAYEQMSKMTAEGWNYRVIEAIEPGVVLTALEKSANADYLAVLRPRVSKAAKFKAVMNAIRWLGLPYDYNFDFSTDSAFVCSEVVYKAYLDSEGLELRPIVSSGRLLLPPNFLAKKFAEEYEKPEQEFDLVLFLDGIEKTQTVAERDAAEFSKTWSRPKWELMHE
jgi:hypothetical protein